MATKERDPITGIETTGHEWDGIKELNTPLPKWWVYVFYVCIVWAIGYWVAMPAWPGLTTYTKGMLGYTSRGAVAADMADLKKVRDDKGAAKLAALSVDDIYKDTGLRNYAVAAGKTAFNENCAACHQQGGAGKLGAYPSLADDEWIWGGTLADIEQTITYGVRNTNPKSRQSEMSKFGVDGILKADEIGQVADFVLTLAKGAADAKLPGAKVFADNCVACHGEKGEGNKDMGAPALNNQLWLYGSTKEAIVAQVTNPKHGSMPAWGERLDTNTIKTLAVYVRSLGGGK
jgi:cytochrome c oxidase cbb3-type subunit 3